MRRQDRPVHELPSFARYLNKVFDFRAVAASLTDSRCNPGNDLQNFLQKSFVLRSIEVLQADFGGPRAQLWASTAKHIRFSLFWAVLADIMPSCFGETLNGRSGAVSGFLIHSISSVDRR